MNITIRLLSDTETSDSETSDNETIEPIYIPFNDAIKMMGDCGYYNKREHAKMWERMGISQSTYYKRQLLACPFYGRKAFSTDKELHLVEKDRGLQFNDDNTSLLSPLGEEIYTDLQVKKEDLDQLIEKLKQELKNEHNKAAET